MNLTQNQLHQIFEARLETPKAQTWKQVSTLLDISPSRLRKARRTREYLDCAYAYCSRHGHGTFAVEQVGSLHPDVASLPFQWQSHYRFESEVATFDDGGRAMFDGTKMRADGIGDCVPRAITIALERDYGEVWNALEQKQQSFRRLSVDNGTFPDVSGPYLKAAGWEYVDIASEELTGVNVCYAARLCGASRMIVVIERHWYACVSGKARDAWNPTERLVWGVWVPKHKAEAVREMMAEYKWRRSGEGRRILDYHFADIPLEEGIT